MDYEILAAELADPVYHGMSDAKSATYLNTEMVDASVESVTGQQLFEAIAPSEFTGLTSDEKMLVLGIVGMGEILVNGTNTRAALLAMFGPGSVTRTNLAGLQTETVSLGVSLGLGHVGSGHVTQARGI